MRGNRVPLLVALAFWLALIPSVQAVPVAPAGGLTCGADIDPTIITPGPYDVGDVVRVNVVIGVGTIQGGTSISVPEVRYALDCFTGTVCSVCDPLVCPLCTDAGFVVSYQGNLSTTCPTIWIDAPADPNTIRFASIPLPVVLFAQTSCELAFDVRIENTLGLSNLESAACFPGTCDNTLTASATGSVSLALGQCGVQVDKQISCDNGVTWNDVGFGDGLVNGCSVATALAPVRVRYLATNLSNGPLANCVLVDSNGGILPAPVNVGGLAVGFTGVIHQAPPAACSDTLDDVEPDSATLVCECPSGDPASDTDQAFFDCRDCDVDLDKQVSCDGGATWNDVGYRDGVISGCTAAAGQTVSVRYLLRNRSVGALNQCTLTESNPAILPAPFAVGSRPTGFDGVIHQVNGLSCAAVAPGEPDTANITCACAPTCQTTCPLCANFCENGCVPDTQASNGDQADVDCTVVAGGNDLPNVPGLPANRPKPTLRPDGR